MAAVSLRSRVRTVPGRLLGVPGRVLSAWRRFLRRGIRRSRTSGSAPGPDRRVELAAERFSRGLRSGVQASPFAGAGSEIRGVRPWVEGDPVRAVDWRVTARRDSLHVRTWQEERELPVILVLDGSPALAGTGEGWYADVLSRAGSWVLRVAEAAGHPLGVATFGGPSASWTPPAPGRTGREAAFRALRCATAGTPAPGGGRLDRKLVVADAPAALEAVTTHHPGEALLVLLSPFDLGPSRVNAMERALAGAGRRHRVVALWADGESGLSGGGVVAVRHPGGRPRLLDRGSARVRARYAEGLEAWRRAVRSLLARHARLTVRLEPGRDPVQELARAFRPGRRRGATRPGPSGPARTPRARTPAGRSVGAGAWVLTAALACAGSLPAQEASGLVLFPGEARVVTDTVADASTAPLPPAPLILGTPSVRRLRVRTVSGARLEPPPPRRGPRWDVTGVRIRRLAGDTLWEVTQHLVPWQSGRLAPPPVPVLLSDAAGLGRVRLPVDPEGGGVRVRPPDPPPGHDPESGPSWPVLPALSRPALWRGVGLLPLLLLAGALVQFVPSAVDRVRRFRRRARPSPPPGLDGLEVLPAREALDRIVSAARVLAREEAGVDPAGWTPASWTGWAGRTRVPPAAELARIVVRADEVRFDPDGDHGAAVQAALPRMRALCHRPGPAGEGEAP